MTPSLLPLEPRDTPSSVVAAALPDGRVEIAGRTFTAFAGWDRVSLAIDQSADRVYVGASGEGAGPRVRAFTLDGRQAGDFFAFDPSFRGGVSVAAADSDLYVAPGLGGGPIVARFRAVDLSPEGQWLVGDADSRAGVVDIAASIIDTPFEAQPLPNNPGDPTAPNLELSLLTQADADRLHAAGEKVLVYGGYGLQRVPELTGIPAADPTKHALSSPNPTGPAGTYQGVAYVSESSPIGTTLHEVGHLIWDTLSDEQQTQWVAFVWPNQTWQHPYEGIDWEAAFAESFRRLRMGEANPPGVDTFLTSVLGEQ